MSLKYAYQGGSNIIVTKQDAAAAETITLTGVNGGGDYSIIGGTIEVITAAAGTLDILIGGVSVLAAAQSTAVAGPKLLVLTDTQANLLGNAGENITIVSSSVTKSQVTLFLSGTLDDLS